MGEEEKLTPKKEEKAVSILDEIKAHKAELEKVRDETRTLVDEARELRAKEILSGKSEAGQQQVKPPEETPEEYVNKLLGRK